MDVVNDVDELELDIVDPTEDVGNLPPGEFKKLPIVSARTATLPPLIKAQVRMRKLIAPWRRIIKLGTVGPDVVAVKRALRKARVIKTKGVITPLAGPFFIRSLKKFQRKHGLKADGQYGERTHRKLLRYFDAYGAYKMAKFHPNKPDKKRAKMKADAMFAYAHAPRRYTQDPTGRCPWYKRVKPPSMWYSADCSGFALWLCWLAGIPNSKCNNYDGWTGSMTESGRGRIIPISEAKPGDMVFYGSPGSGFHHVAVYVGSGRVVSHGHEGGPFLVSAWYRSDLSQVRTYL
jgi:cell wall-associated NlpC family hydrolase